MTDKANDNAVAGRRAAELLPPGGERQDTWYEVIEREDDAEARSSLRGPMIAGISVVILAFGGFFGWAASASLDAAAVATGTVMVDSKRKTVSHLEGGILKGLAVHEGEVVKEGQPLMLLDDTRARSELERLQGKRMGLLARLARLRAEQTGAKEIAFPALVLNTKDPIANDVREAETRLFAKRLDAYGGKIDFQRKEIDKYAAEADSAAALIDSSERQRAFVSERLDGLKSLATRGFVAKAQVLEQEARLSELIGRTGDYKAQKARAEQAKAGAAIAVASVEYDWQSDVADQLQIAQLELNEVENQITSARDIFTRLEVRSPQAGAVANIQKRTPGSALLAGEALMDIVPEHEPMIIEARLNTRDIVSVRNGTKAQVRLTAYDHRTLAPVEGKLTYVAADQTLDPNTQAAYYVVRAEIAPDALKDHPSVSLYPGMPAELMVMKRPRRAIDYLFEPITESFNRAFREN